MRRLLETEWIDQMPADDPAAVVSRRDMLRLNRIMGHAGVLRKNLRDAHRAGSRKLADLGTGDGRLLLFVAGQLANEGVRFDGLLLDARPSIQGTTLENFQRLGWKMQAVAQDVFDWLEPLPPGSIDVMTSTLFLHHLAPDQLSRLFDLAADRVNLLIACEPLRTPPAWWAAKCVWLIGCNAVTRHDAPVSVRAGFAGNELSEVWPRRHGWKLEERRLGLFSHLFIARRESADS